MDPHPWSSPVGKTADRGEDFQVARNRPLIISFCHLLSPGSLPAWTCLRFGRRASENFANPVLVTASIAAIDSVDRPYRIEPMPRTRHPSTRVQRPKAASSNCWATASNRRYRYKAMGSFGHGYRSCCEPGRIQCFCRSPWSRISSYSCVCASLNLR